MGDWTIEASAGAIEAVQAERKGGEVPSQKVHRRSGLPCGPRMPKRNDHYDTIRMPLHSVDPPYLSFRKLVQLGGRKKQLGTRGIEAWRMRIYSSCYAPDGLPTTSQAANSRPGGQLHRDQSDQERPANRQGIFRQMGASQFRRAWTTALPD